MHNEHNLIGINSHRQVNIHLKQSIDRSKRINKEAVFTKTEMKNE